MTLPEFLSNFILIVTVCYAFYVSKKSNSHKLLDLTFAFALAIIISEVLKYFFNVPRPDNIYAIEGASFPSTHSSIVWCAVFFNLFVITKFHTKRHFFNMESTRKIAHNDIFNLIVLLLLAFLVMISRVMMNVHTWLDVFGGMLVGFIAVIPFMYFDISGRRIK